MELTNEFTVDVPVEEAWSILTDVTRIAPCMPGAQLQEIEGDEYRGVVKVKVGPVTAEYRGKAVFLEQDAVAHRAVLRAEGRETRGQGNASATITATLVPEGATTRVSVVTDLTITGRVAQFGRGVLADVSSKLLDQFASSLESMVLADHGTETTAGEPGSAAATTGGGSAEAGTAVGGGGGGGRSATERSNGDRGAIGQPAEAAPVDLVKVVGPVVLKRVVPVVAGLLVVWAVWRLRRRCR
jgi:carbon monoxide dehydrogenase subunit G